MDSGTRTKSDVGCRTLLPPPDTPTATATWPATPHARQLERLPQVAAAAVTVTSPVQSDSRIRIRSGADGNTRKKMPPVVDLVLLPADAVGVGHSGQARLSHGGASAAFDVHSTWHGSRCGSSGGKRAPVAIKYGEMTRNKYRGMKSWSWAALLDYTVRLNHRSTAHNGCPIRGLVGLALLPKVCAVSGALW